MYSSYFTFHSKEKPEILVEGVDSPGFVWYNTLMLNDNNKPNIVGPMSQQSHGSHSVFARLMSTENITVLFDPKSKDAWFDTKTRTLNMPGWTGMTPEVYDLLLSHEVSHALHTPCDGWIGLTDELAGEKASDADKQVARQYINIIEDARIERLIKAKYPGLARDYIKGYKWLAEKKMFGDLSSDLSGLNFIDRINLHFKVGSHADYTIPFSAEEQEIVSLVEQASTFDDVKKVTRLVWDHANGASSPNPQKQKGKGNGSGEDGEDGEANGEGSEGDGTGTKHKPGGLNRIAPQTTKNQERFLEKHREKRDPYNNGPDRPCILPEYDLSKVIVPSSTIYSQIGEAMGDCTKCGEWLAEARGELAGFISEAKPTVDAMVKAFMLKKAATAHHRSQNAKSGTLDMGLLSTYKWNEDLFKHFTIKPNGKNHGFILLLDWSGSMGGVILNVVKQMYTLTSFFRRIGVPFDVYAFSSNQPSDKYYGDYYDYRRTMQDEQEATKFEDLAKGFITNSTKPNVATHSPFFLYNFASSTMNGATYKDAMEKLWMLAYNMNPSKPNYTFHAPSFPYWLGLGDTPLDHSLVASVQMVKEFRKKHRAEIMNVVVVTDGSTSSSPLENHYYGGGDRFTRLTNPRTGASYSLRNNISTNVLASYLMDETGCNTMMLFLSANNTPNEIVPGYTLATPDGKVVRDANKYYLKDDEAGEALQKHWNEEYYLSALPVVYTPDGKTVGDGLGFGSVFAIRIARKAEADAYEDLDMTNTTYTRLKSQFVKSLSRKIVSRSLVNRMVEAVAKHT